MNSTAINESARAASPFRKRLVLGAVALGACLSGLTASAEIEYLEFLETSGTQWIDTGLRLNFRRSVYRLNFRVLERRSARAGFAGVTDVKDSANGSGRSFAVGQKAGNGGQGLIQWCVVGEGDGYFHPNAGNYDATRGWELENDVATALFNGSRIGDNPSVPERNGHPVGHYDSSKPDENAVNTFYIGAVNNAGEGLFQFEADPPKMHWYGARFWTDGELVGDFVPARQDGIAGFYDKVTKSFFRSQGADDFIAPEHVTWIGGNDGSLSDHANWSGGGAPSNVHQVAVFPAGVTKHYSVGEHNAVLRDLGGINLVGADTLLWLDDVNVASTMAYAPVCGKGTYRLEKKSNDTNSMTMLGNSCNFEGLFDFTNAYVCTEVPSAFGECGKAKARYHANFSNVRLTLSCPLMHADLLVGQTGAFVFVVGSPIFDGRLEFYSDRNSSFHANAVCSATFNCDIVSSSETRRTLSLLSGYYKTGLETKSRDFGMIQVQAANFRVDRPVRFSRQAGSYTIYNQCNFALNTGGDKGLVFGCENAFNDEVFVLMGYAKDIRTQPVNIIDLGGYNQRFGKLGMYTTDFDGTTTWNTNAVITSATPATLTILETFRNDHSDGTGSYSSAYSGRVNGAASIVLDDAEIVDPCGSQKRMRFNCPGSDTTGFLQANAGYIDIASTATFSNLTALVATKTGLIKVNTRNVGIAANLLVSVTNATTAKIEIAADVILSADKAFMGTQWLDPGWYSSADGVGVKACPFLTGTGFLKVARYGGSQGFTITVR